MTRSAPNLDQVEFHLPQFAHLVIHIAEDVPETAVLERFILAVCQVSTHIALQYFWIVYAVLEENNPKHKSDGGAARVYRRCAELLLHLEQSVVYGCGKSADLSEGLDELMKRCVQVAERTSSWVTDAKADADDVVFEGWLWKKGGGTSFGGRRAWSRRYMQMRTRVLYYFASKKGSRPRGSILLSALEVVVPAESKYPYYFELRCRQSGLVLRMRAETEDEMRKWVNALSAASSLPQPPGVEGPTLKEALVAAAQANGESAVGSAANKKASLESITVSFAEHTPRGNDDDESPRSASRQSPTADVNVAPTMLSQQRAAYSYFDAQRDFLRSLTNLAEKLRAMPPESRQSALQPSLDELRIPDNAYFPLTHSSEKMLRLLGFAESESIVFNTKARCPVLLVLETQQQSYSVSFALAMSDAAAEGVPPAKSGNGVAAATPSAPLSLSEKKREGWVAKTERVRKSSARGGVPGWSLRSLIIKSNDDVRQEVFIMQMISYFERIFPSELCWLRPYHIQATGPDTGLIETITSAQDLDHLKKAPGFVSLRQLFISRYGEPDSDGFKAAQDRFCRSLAGYSVVMYLLLLRDRHNGNLMLDDEGHFFHVDFGFVLGHSTGKQIGGLVECAPFKLTKEYVELLDGVGSAVYRRFCDGCVQAMREARHHGDTICTLVEIAGTRSNFPCFMQTPVHKVLHRLRKRLLMEKKDEEVEEQVLHIVKTACDHSGTRYYDYAQQLQRGIAA